MHDSFRPFQSRYVFSNGHIAFQGMSQGIYFMKESTVFKNIIVLMLIISGTEAAMHSPTEIVDKDYLMKGEEVDVGILFKLPEPRRNAASLSSVSEYH